MKTLRAIIADDEELARRILREYLSGEPDIEIVEECPNGFEAVKAVNDHQPDILFLDVQMPKLDGFEVLELVESTVAVVFVTAYDQYAMKAFDAAAVDYLLKPFTAERFRASLDRVRARSGIAGDARAAVPAPLPRDLKMASRPPGEFLERLVVKDGPRVHVIAVGKLDYAEAQDDYVALRSEGKTWLKQQTITSLEAALDPRRFLRVHRSFLVNMERITRVEPNTRDTWQAILRDGTKIPMSRAGYSRFRELAGGE
jgi:two-component system LytT family response regulator